jgi:integrase
MKTSKIKITPINVKGERYWQLVWPKHNGGRNRQAFKLKTEAEREMAKKKAEIASYGAAAASMPEKLRMAAVNAHDKLTPYGKTIDDAVDFYVKHLAAQAGGKGLREAVDLFLESRKADASDRYYNSIKNRLETMVKRLPAQCTTSQVSSSQLDDFLATFTAPATKRSYKANMRTFFNWCVTKSFCQTNPATGLQVIKSRKDGEIGILTPEELARLLEQCDDSILPGVVLGAFCGIRQAEISRLQWGAIDLEEKIVTIAGSIAKTGARRITKIPDNAVEWLTPLAQKEGAVWPAGEEYRRPWNIARLRCGWGPFQSTCAAVNAVQNRMTKAQLKKLRAWPDNALRHSAISYKLAKTRDLAQVATEAGNSPNMIKQHYDALVKPTAAETWFAIRPAEVASGKVTRFRKAKAA